MRKTAIYGLCVVSSILLMACGKKNTDTATMNTLLTDYAENDIAMERTSLENMTQDASEETKTEAEPENTEAQTEVQEEIFQGGAELLNRRL